MVHAATLLQHAIADATVSRGHLDTLHDAHAAALPADVGHQGARESIGGASLLARTICATAGVE